MPRNPEDYQDPYNDPEEEMDFRPEPPPLETLLNQWQETQNELLHRMNYTRHRDEDEFADHPELRGSSLAAANLTFVILAQQSAAGLEFANEAERTQFNTAAAGHFLERLVGDEGFNPFDNPEEFRKDGLPTPFELAKQEVQEILAEQLNKGEDYAADPKGFQKAAAAVTTLVNSLDD